MREKAANGRSFHPGQVHGAFGGHNDCTLGHQLDTPESFCEWNPPKNDTPRKINMEPENTPLEIRKIIFQTLIFRFYVNLPGCNGLKPPGNSEHFRFYGKIFGSRVYPIPLPFGFFFRLELQRLIFSRGFHHRVFSTWMSRWKLGSMVSTPIYPIYR